jgi:hypothetical protein
VRLEGIQLRLLESISVCTVGGETMMARNRSFLVMHLNVVVAHCFAVVESLRWFPDLDGVVVLGTSIHILCDPEVVFWIFERVFFFPIQ